MTRTWQAVHPRAGTAIGPARGQRARIQRPASDPPTRPHAYQSGVEAADRHNPALYHNECRGGRRHAAEPFDDHRDGPSWTGEDDAISPRIVVPHRHKSATAPCASKLLHPGQEAGRRDATPGSMEAQLAPCDAHRVRIAHAGFPPWSEDPRPGLDSKLGRVQARCVQHARYARSDLRLASPLSKDPDARASCVAVTVHLRRIGGADRHGGGRDDRWRPVLPGGPSQLHRAAPPRQSAGRLGGPTRGRHASSWHRARGWPRRRRQPV